MPVLTDADRALLRRRHPSARRSRRRGRRHRGRCGRSRADCRARRPAPPGGAGASSRRCSVVGADQRHIAVQHQHLRAVGHARHRLLHARGRCRAAAPVRAQCRSGWSANAALHLIAAMAVHDVDAGRLQRARGVDHVRQHRPAGDAAAAPWAAPNFMRLPSPAARMTTCRGADMGDSGDGDCTDSNGGSLLRCGAVFERNRDDCTPPDDPRATPAMTLGRHARHYTADRRRAMAGRLGRAGAAQPLGHGDRAGQRRRARRRRTARLLAQWQADLRRRRNRDRPDPAAALRADVAGHDHGQHLVAGRDRPPRSACKWAWLAKPGIEVVLGVVGFLLSRHWVYRK